VGSVCACGGKCVCVCVSVNVRKVGEGCVYMSVCTCVFV
jgi:hypothetical protein